MQKTKIEELKGDLMKYIEDLPGTFPLTKKTKKNTFKD